MSHLVRAFFLTTAARSETQRTLLSSMIADRTQPYFYNQVLIGVVVGGDTCSEHEQGIAPLVAALRSAPPPQVQILVGEAYRGTNTPHTAQVSVLPLNTWAGQRLADQVSYQQLKQSTHSAAQDRCHVWADWDPSRLSLATASSEETWHLHQLRWLLRRFTPVCCNAERVIATKDMPDYMSNAAWGLFFDETADSRYRGRIREARRALAKG